MLCSRPAAAASGVPGFGPRIFRRACLPRDGLLQIFWATSLSLVTKGRGGHHVGQESGGFTRLRTGIRALWIPGSSSTHPITKSDRFMMIAF